MTAATVQDDVQDEQRQDVDVEDSWLKRALARVNAEQGCPAVGAEFNSAF